MNPNKKKKFVVPEDFNFEMARDMFLRANVISDKVKLEEMIKFNRADEKRLREFLIKSKGFGEAKVDNGLTKLRKWQSRPNQSRLSNFFGGGVKKQEPQFGIKW
jgi:hypothetical protein